MSLIQLSNLSKIFHLAGEEIFALREVTLTINAGEFVSITGPSGSGKSTLLYVLGLLDKASSGRYELDEIVTDTLLDDERAKIRNQKLGFVFQGFHLLPRATALRNVMMPLVYAANHRVAFTEPQMRELATEALAAVGLADRISHLPNELSGGQRQRVAIARALVNKPRVLLADEPTGNLDSRSGAGILNLFSELHRSGVTILMVTHDQSIAAAAQRRIKLRDGGIEADEA